MAITRSLESKGGREYFCKIQYGEDLLAAIKGCATRLNVRTGVLNVIGALQSASLGYYDQGEKRFLTNHFSEPLEIASGMGNIAMLNGETIVHCHLVLANRGGACFGGHLVEGCRVFAGELYLRELSPVLGRKFDPQTGLNLFEIA